MSQGQGHEGPLTSQICTDGTASHTAVVPRNVAFAVQWGEAKLDGQALPTCSADGMPPCTP